MADYKWAMRIPGVRRRRFDAEVSSSSLSRVQMNRDVAESLMKELLALSDPLNTATSLTARISEREERESLRRALGEIMSKLYTELMIPIISEHRDFDPDK